MAEVETRTKVARDEESHYDKSYYEGCFRSFREGLV